MNIRPFFGYVFLFIFMVLFPTVACLRKVETKKELLQERPIESDDWTILPAVGLRKMKIGESYEQIVNRIGDPEFSNQYDYAFDCKRRVAIWVYNSNAVVEAVFDDKDVAIIISVSHPFFRTNTDLRIDSSFPDKPETFTNRFQAFVDMGLLNNQYPNVFLVDYISGEAYRLSKTEPNGSWYVSGISVFPQKFSFIPRGHCGSADENMFYSLDSKDFDKEIRKFL